MITTNLQLFTIIKTISWILNKVSSSQRAILDLGCGLGLYTEKLVKRGHLVSRADISANSIVYAKVSAQKKKLNTCYRHQDYLTLTGWNVDRSPGNQSWLYVIRIEAGL